MNWEQMKDRISSQTISQAIQQLPDRLLIYGAGAFGQELFTLLSQEGHPVMGFLDANAEDGAALFGLPVWNLQNVPQAIKDIAPLVLFSIVMDCTERVHAMEVIHKTGFQHIREAQSLRCLMVDPDDRSTNESLQEYYAVRWRRIQSAATRFHEPKSRQIFWNNLEAHMTRDYSGCTLEDPLGRQYFPEDIPWKRHTHVIDCGAYIGDTAQQFLQLEGPLAQYTGFEPNQSNFARLASFCLENRKKLGAITLFPCGVGGFTGPVSFQTGTGSGRITQTGGEVVTCIALDDALKNHSVDLIKMDIEGTELRALMAAKEMITQYTPDLAVCVYHHINHLWDIPLLLHGWDLGYTFYLRCYNACTMETVLYATADSSGRKGI